MLLIVKCNWTLNSIEYTWVNIRYNGFIAAKQLHLISWKNFSPWWVLVDNIICNTHDFLHFMLTCLRLPDSGNYLYSYVLMRNETSLCVVVLELVDALLCIVSRVKNLEIRWNKSLVCNFLERLPRICIQAVLLPFLFERLTLA